MTEHHGTDRLNRPVFDVTSGIEIGSSPSQVYRVISDLPASGAWSVECRGGSWTSGTPGTVGAVFLGENERSPDVVEWAPVVRGSWTTEAEIVAADPPRRFAWAMRDSSGYAQESVWSFDIASSAPGSHLSHSFRMDSLTEGMRQILADLSPDDVTRFLKQWQSKLSTDLAHTLGRIRDLVERQR